MILDIVKQKQNKKVCGFHKKFCGFSKFNDNRTLLEANFRNDHS